MAGSRIKTDFTHSLLLISLPDLDPTSSHLSWQDLIRSVTMSTSPSFALMTLLAAPIRVETSKLVELVQNCFMVSLRHSGSLTWAPRSFMRRSQIACFQLSTETHFLVGVPTYISSLPISLPSELSRPDKTECKRTKKTN